jgi:fatty acid desaturase
MLALAVSSRENSCALVFRSFFTERDTENSPHMCARRHQKKFILYFYFIYFVSARKKVRGSESEESLKSHPGLLFFCFYTLLSLSSLYVVFVLLALGYMMLFISSFIFYIYGQICKSYSFTSFALNEMKFIFLMY